MANNRKFFSNPILPVVIAALVVAAALIAVSEFSAHQKQQTVIGPGPEQPSEEPAQPTEEPSQPQPQPQPEQPQKTPVITAQPTEGDPDAPVTIVEFAEFYCPFCAKYLWETFPQIEKDYIEKGLVKYEFRNLVVHGAISLLTAVAGECAQEQGKFWEFHDRLFETVFPGRNIYQHEQLEIDDLKRVAAQVGLDMESFNRCIEGYNSDYNRCLADYKQCAEGGEDKEQCAEEFNRRLSSNRMMEKILDDQQELRRLIDRLPPDEQEQAKRIGTPTFFINGHIFIGAQPYDNFKQVIERELERAQGE